MISDAHGCHIVAPAIAARWGASPVRLAATVIGAGVPGTYGQLVPATARRAYEMAGVGPADLDVIECHDAASPAELIVTEELGLCAPGDAVKMLRAGGVIAMVKQQQGAAS